MYYYFVLLWYQKDFIQPFSIDFECYKASESKHKSKGYGILINAEYNSVFVRVVHLNQCTMEVPQRPLPIAVCQSMLCAADFNKSNI